MLENIELNKNNTQDKSVKTDKTDKMNRMNVKDYLKPNLRSITRNVKTTTKNVKRAAKKFDTSSKITEYFGQEPSRDKKKRVIAHLLCQTPPVLSTAIFLKNLC